MDSPGDSIDSSGDYRFIRGLYGFIRVSMDSPGDSIDSPGTL